MRNSLFALLVLAGASLPAQAQNLSVLIDGQPVVFDQPPVMQGGRVLVPLRGIFEKLGAHVHYDAATRHIQAEKGPVTVELTLGLPQASVSGKPVMLDAPADTIGGRTVVPLRFVSEALGAEVHWMAATRTIEITSPVAVAPPPPPPPEPPPPVGINLLPGDHSRVNGSRPRIGAALSEPFRFDTVHLQVDGVELPLDQIEHNATGLQWLPNHDLTDGPHHVSLDLSTLDNRPVHQRWGFDVASGRPLLQGVELSAAGLLAGGQTFQITAHGVPAAAVTWDLGGRKGMRMDEVGPGVYQASYTVANEDHGVFRPTVHLVLRDGRTDSRPGRPLWLNVPPSVQVASPVMNQRVGPGFPLRGQTFPGARIEARLQFMGMPGPGQEFHGNANPDGLFDIPISVQNVPPGSPFSLRVEVFDPQNHRSAPTVLQLTRG